MYYVYMIKNLIGKLYTGITDNPTQRLHTHNTKSGAKFTKDDNKFSLVFFEDYPTLTEARQREIQIKKWRRDKKELLIQKYSQGFPTKSKTEK